MPAYSFMTHLECPKDGRRYDADRVQHLCGCGAPLLVRYDLPGAGRALAREALAGREPSLWRYHELLPVQDPARVVTLGEGMTPLLPLRFGKEHDYVDRITNIVRVAKQQ